MVELKEDYSENENNRICPGSKLEAHIYYLNPKNFRKLRAYEPENGFSEKDRLEIETYEYFNEVSKRLFKFLELGEFICDEENLRVLSKEEFQKKIALADKIEENNREYIFARLTEHVAECRTCFPEYKRILKGIARLKIQSQRVKFKSKEVKKRMLRNIISDLDLEFLGLLDD